MIEKALEDELVARARKRAPDELCGFLVPEKGRYIFHELQNKAADKTAQFQIDETAAAPFLAHEKACLFHSHPQGPAYPSSSDLRLAKSLNRDCVILALHTDGEHEFFTFGKPQKLALDSRFYRHGVTDCYGLIRDYFAFEKDIILPDFPRHWGWWHEGGDHYKTHFKEFGFRRLKESEPLQKDDVFIAKLRAPVANHAGLYCGDGAILHHPAGRHPVDRTRRVRREPLLRYLPFIEFWLRYEGIN